MSERGVFALDRGVFGHGRFADEPFTEREAWIWMIGQAAFRPHCKRVGSIPVTLRRGEFAHSIRFMAEKWQWSATTVRRFLERLATDDGEGTLIGTRSDTGITVVSVRSYDAYQARLFPSGEVNGAENGAASAQQRPKEESIAEEVVVEGKAAATSSNPDVLAEDIELARSCLRAKGDDVDGPGVITLAYQAAMWRAREIPREEILATFAEIAGKAEKFTLSYYIAAITGRDRRKRERPPNAAQPHLPLGLVVATESAHGQTAPNHPAPGWKQSRDAFRTARSKFKAGLAAAESATDCSGESDGPPVRLVAAPGRG